MFAVGFLSVVVLFGWMFSVGVGLKKYLPSEVKSKTRFFIFCMFFPLAYFAIFIGIQLASMASMFSTMMNPEMMEAPEAMVPNMLGMFGLMSIIIPLHLFSMFCGIYVFRFVAKILRRVELKRRARLGDYIG